MTAVASVTTEKFIVRVESDSTVTIIGNVTSALSAAMSAVAAEASAAASAAAQASAEAAESGAEAAEATATAAAGTATTQAGIAAAAAATATTQQGIATTAAATATAQAVISTTQAGISTAQAVIATAQAAAAAASAAAAAISEANAAAAVTGGLLAGSFTSIKASDNVVIAATKKLYLDGVAGVGGDSYIVESSANVVDHYAGGVKALSLTASAVAVAGMLASTGSAAFGVSAPAYGAAYRLHALGAAIITNTNDYVPQTLGNGLHVIGGSGIADALAPGILTLGEIKTAVAANDVLGRLRWYSNDGSTSMAGIVGKIDLLAEADFTASQAKTSLTFHTNTGVADSLAERMRISSEGNVGIGMAPVANSNYLVLDYKGRAATQALVSRFYTSDGTQTGAIQSDTNYGFLAAAVGARPFSVFTNGSERLQVNSAGTLGIAATAKLTLDGVAGTGDTYLVESSSNVLDFYAGGVKALFLNSSGVTAQYGLTVVGTTEGVNQSFNSGTDENRLALAAAVNYGSNNGVQTKWTLRWKGRGNGGTIGPSYSHFALYDELNAAYRLFVGYNGSIGIGHTAPTATMDIAGTFSLSSAGGVSPATYSARALISSSSVDGDGALSIANTTASAAGAGQRHGVILHGGSTAFGLSSWVSSLVVEGQANGGVHIGAYATGASIRLSVGNSRAALATLNATSLTLASAVDFVQAATKKHYLDGGGDTYLVESSANVLDIYAGGTKALSLTAAGLKMAGGRSQFAGDTAPAAGYGVEIGHNGTTGAVLSYDRTAAGYKALNIDGLTINLQASSATKLAVSSTGCTLSGDTVIATKTPASAAAAGTSGTIAWDTNYLYACTATDTWKRAALSTW